MGTADTSQSAGAAAVGPEPVPPGPPALPRVVFPSQVRNFPPRVLCWDCSMLPLAPPPYIDPIPLHPTPPHTHRWTPHPFTLPGTFSATTPHPSTSPLLHGEVLLLLYSALPQALVNIFHKSRYPTPGTSTPVVASLGFGDGFAGFGLTPIPLGKPEVSAHAPRGEVRGVVWWMPS